MAKNKIHEYKCQPNSRTRVVKYLKLYKTPMLHESFLQQIVSMATMSFTAGMVGEGSIRLGQAINSPDLPKKMSFVSSLIAIIIGMYYLLS